MPTISKSQEVSFGVDSIVIRNYVAGILGGRVLDVSNFTPEYIKAGHVIIRDTQKGAFKPMPVTGDAYSTLPENHEYVGVAVATVSKESPLVGIMYDGEVNDQAAPYSFDSIKAALKTAVPTLRLDHD